jgi:hypothetical protein
VRRSGNNHSSTQNLLIDQKERILAHFLFMPIIVR